MKERMNHIIDVPVELDLPPPSVLSKLGQAAERMSILSEVEDSVLAIATNLINSSPSEEVGLSQYKQAMRNSGYTGESAVFELHRLIRSGSLRLSDRYRISLASE